jgi:hypothetical protein
LKTFLAGGKLTIFFRSIVALGNIYFFYTIPLTAVAALANPDNLTTLFPNLADPNSDRVLDTKLLSSLIAALIWDAFFM